MKLLPPRPDLNRRNIGYVAAAIIAITLLVYSLIFLGSILVHWLRVPENLFPQLQFRVIGWIFLVAGGAIAVWVVLTRGILNMLLSTGITFLKLFGRYPIKEVGSRSEQLVIRGPQKYMRNPLYLGAMVSLVGWSLVTDSSQFLVVTCLILIWFTTVQIPFEERELFALFGPDYKEYAQGVPALIPFTIPSHSEAIANAGRIQHHNGAILFLMIFLEGTLGVASFTFRNSLILGIHITMGITVLVISLKIMLLSSRSQSGIQLIASIFTFLFLSLTTISGVYSLLSGNVQLAAIDKILALCALLAASLIVVTNSSAVDKLTWICPVSQ